MTKISNIYSVLDCKTGQFLSLDLFVNDLEAERFLKRQLKLQPDLLFNQFPEDFSLYRLGTFDYEKGIEDRYDDPIKVCDVTALLNNLTSVTDVNKTLTSSVA